MLRKTSWLLILSVFILSSCAMFNNKADLYKSIIKSDKIIVGISFDSKPFGFKDSTGQVQGMEADLARQIAQRLLGNPNKVVFKNVNPQDRIKVARAGNVDMVISTMTINSQRKKLVNFSVPYFVAGQVICVRRNSKVYSIYDLMNKRVIVILGTTGEKNIKRLIPNALIQGYVNNSDAINAFKSGQGEAITTDDALLQGLVAESKDYRLLSGRLTQEPYGIAFRKSMQTNYLRNNINKILNELNLDGTLQALRNKWVIY